MAFKKIIFNAKNEIEDNFLTFYFLIISIIELLLILPLKLDPIFKVRDKVVFQESIL